MAGLVGIVLSIMIGGTFFVLQGGGEAEFTVLMSMLQALLLIVCSIGLGSQILRRRDPSWDYCLVVGLLFWGMVLLPISLLGGLRFAVCLYAPMLLLFWKNRHVVRWPTYGIQT